MTDERREIGNLIRVADKDMSHYSYAILLAIQPFNYDKYGEIKIQVTMSNLPKAEYLIKLFENAGLIEKNREKKEIQVVPDKGISYTLRDAFEITLRKIPALE